jgi:hypothetical protein
VSEASKPPRVPLPAQIAELEREARYRRDVVEQFTARGLEPPAGADAQDAALAAALRTLKWMLANEAAIRAAVKT